MIAVLIWTISCFPPARSIFCSQEDSNCFREWVSALSGWVAAFVALFTLIPLYNQVRLQREQTAFQLGDAPPTFDAVQHTESEQAVLIRITNWNRRGMLIRGIWAEDDKPIEALWYGTSDNTQKNRALDLGFHVPLILEGWVDREHRPVTMRIKIQRASAADVMNSSAWDRCTLAVRYELVGEDRINVLKAPVHLTSGLVIELEE
ncbi:hypothetical protein [Rhizobium sp. BG4]|uniref:hypothetical protein n=1 Tax=Rhizobium sp. BG4 TaxID=2613770 RepID=UPI00193CAAC8|nr:hypothetical protein [Rhizobium sp. BG4]QRM43133.1 hypothetical protein F2982_06585 [Rhizobium sp. BG4]